jgi:hypothetical protein
LITTGSIQNGWNKNTWSQKMKFKEANQLYRSKAAKKDWTADPKTSYFVSPDKLSGFWQMRDSNDNHLAIVHASGKVVLNNKK